MEKQLEKPVVMEQEIVTTGETSQVEMKVESDIIIAVVEEKEVVDVKPIIDIVGIKDNPDDLLQREEEKMPIELPMNL